jgi:hypothetical protein
MPGFLFSVAQRKARPWRPGFGVRRGERGGRVAGNAVADYQLKRGPTNHWVSPSANFTSAEALQFGVNFTCAPRRP